MLRYPKLNNNFLNYFFIVIGILTIFYQINFEDLWLDEMQSFWIADPELSLSETLQRHKNYDYHNPVIFNLTLKYFLDIFSYNPEIARYLPLIYGSLFLIIIGPITRQVKKDNTFLFTTFLACLSIYIIKYSQEVRPYSLLLITSALNIYFFLKVIDKKKENKKNIFFFIFFSIINYSVNPFSLIILFSQIFFITYKYFFFNDRYIQLYIFALLISISYLLLNYSYISYQISFDNYMLSSDIINVIDGLYFPRFFGSKIMGYFYLLLLLFLIIKCRKKIFLENNNYLFFLTIIFFSYLIPLIYGILSTPVLHDRYIIFILIPILILISCLLNELKNQRLKQILFSLLILLTIGNHLIEIFDRPKTKPEFNYVLNQIKKKDYNNIFLYNPRGTSIFIMNYLKNIQPNIEKELNFYDFKNLKENINSFWVLCYMPEVYFKCKVKTKDNFKIIEKKKTRLVHAYLVKKY
tara:strand:+ start:786 stop:2183 length:1398 start_codon:yes stop_codon:yes gene_type:complete